MKEKEEDKKYLFTKPMHRFAELGFDFHLNLPYSPNLTQSNYWLFAKLKIQLRSNYLVIFANLRKPKVYDQYIKTD